MAPAPTPEAVFRKDEKVLCFHHELLYDAKIIDVRGTDEDGKKTGFEYKVHYKGWKNTYVCSLFAACLPPASSTMRFLSPRLLDILSILRLLPFSTIQHCHLSTNLLRLQPSFPHLPKEVI